ncbi:hypothetical protein C8C83_3473 [Flavobacterium sp. 90]|uniref:hypothetical protein n=1 Tax=unclassified Flavobacterium TaxID=196869 RepID=UPI000EB378B9|nr:MULTISPECIES: hypothetical protein [unclassified Flavobacterium]RKR11727.1 hypothetical protein C8C82_3791 [Flavobacterium sp. 81]TCK55503.1 hypothetical protein C8C83_3473 [Flavobacterium sp. 90]
MKSTLDQIEEIKRNGYTLDFGSTFNYAFENYKKIALYSGLIILVFTIIMAVLAMGLAVTFYGVAAISKDFILNLENYKLSYLEQLLSIGAFSAFAALLAPFGAGFLKMADCADKDEEFNVSTIFTYYKAPYFTQLFIMALILALVSNAISAVIESFGIMLLGNAISIFISFFTFIAIPLVVFGNLSAVDAIKGSVIVVTKSPLLIFALFITGIIGSMVGLIGCCIGVLFTIIFNTSVTYATYYSIFTEEEQKDVIDSIGQSDFE